MYEWRMPVIVNPFGWHRSEKGRLSWKLTFQTKRYAGNKICEGKKAFGTAQKRKAAAKVSFRKSSLLAFHFRPPTFGSFKFEEGEW